MKDLPKTRVSSGNRWKILDQKESKVPVLPWRAKQRKHKTPKAQTECGSCNHEEKIEEKLKSNQLKLFCKTKEVKT